MSFLSKRKKFWKRFEGSIFEVIELAIDLLRKKDKLPLNEDDLNRELYFCLVTANYQLQKMNKGLETPPFYESNNQPRVEDKIRAQREFKRPDFQWSITDIYEQDSKMSSKQFVLECKRLGKAVGTWVLNENYINHGIKRFIDQEHGYAYGVISSAMLGYIQSMESEDILSEVNTNVVKIKQAQLKKQSNNNSILRLSHEIKKDFPINTLRLEHIWLDIRIFY